MWCCVYIVSPSVLGLSNLKLHQTLEVKNISQQENVMFQLRFNPGLTLTRVHTSAVVDVERDMINAISAADIAFIMSSSQAIVN